MTASSRLIVLAVVFGGAACNHTSSFTTDDDRDREAFGSIVPVRLTFDAGADVHPHWTASGQTLLYSFERQLPLAEYPDRCLGALPARGGQRIQEWCWSSWDESTRRDGIEWGALDDAGRLVFTHHFSAGEKQPLPFGGHVYAADAGSFAARTEVAELMVPHSEAASQWDYITAPVFTGPDQVMGLAATIAVEVKCFNCAFDTTWTGADLVRVSLGATPQVERVVELRRADFLSWDRSVSRFFFGRDNRIETVPTEGGDVRFVWQVPRSPDRRDVTLSGAAAASGRIAVTFHWEQGDLANPTPHSVIGVLTADGDVLELRHETDGVRWGKISLSPDGRRLAAERRIGTERDLYLFELPE